MKLNTPTPSQISTHQKIAHREMSEQALRSPMRIEILLKGGAHIDEKASIEPMNAE
jgi:hypothetical protein